MKKEFFFSVVIAIVITILGVCTTKVCSDFMFQWTSMFFAFTLVAVVITSTVIESFKKGWYNSNDWCFLVLAWLMPIALFLMGVLS